MPLLTRNRKYRQTKQNRHNFWQQYSHTNKHFKAICTNNPRIYMIFTKYQGDDKFLKTKNLSMKLVPWCNALLTKASNSPKLSRIYENASPGCDAISYSSLVLPLRIPNVNMVTPCSLSSRATGRGSPPFEKPSVMRKRASREPGRPCCSTAYNEYKNA